MGGGCLRALAVAAALIASAPPAYADQREDARAHFDRGAEMFRAGRYADARAQFQEAYAAMPDPRVLANIAACYAAEDRVGEALSVYRRVLTHEGRPLSPQARRRVEAEMDALRARMAQAESWGAQPVAQGAPPPAQQAPPPEVETPIGRGPLLWTGVGLGTALAIAGTVTGILALDTRAQVDDQSRDLDERRRLRDQTRTLSVTTDVLIDAALLIGVATVVLYAFGGPSEREDGNEPRQADLEGGGVVAGGERWPLGFAF